MQQILELAKLLDEIFVGHFDGRAALDAFDHIGLKTRERFVFVGRLRIRRSHQARIVFDWQARGQK